MTTFFLQVEPTSESTGLYAILFIVCLAIFILIKAKPWKENDFENQILKTPPKKDPLVVEKKVFEEVTFDDVQANDDEEEHRIAGISKMNLSKEDIGYSESFYIRADTSNRYDKYAVEIYNERKMLVGYIPRGENEFWHKLLTYRKDLPVLKCRGYVGTFMNDRLEMAYYGKIFLPIVEQDEDYKKVMNHK